MTRKTWVLVIASVLVSSIPLEGQGFAAGERKKIVMGANSIELLLLQQALQQLVLRGSKIKVVHTLSFINALALERPDGTPDEAKADLEALLERARALGASGVNAYDDLEFSVLPINCRVEVTLIDKYPWGLVHIGADVAHQQIELFRNKR